MNQSSFDKVILRECRFDAQIGLTEEERSSAQPIVIDMEISMPEWHAAQSAGDIYSTIDYDEVRSTVETLIKSKEWVLIEDLASSICSLIFRKFRLTQEIAIQIRKFVLPDTAWAGVEMVRKRNV